jgi:peptide-methionine (S)-S-oxide reductase
MPTAVTGNGRILHVDGRRSPRETHYRPVSTERVYSWAVIVWGLGLLIERADDNKESKVTEKATFAAGCFWGVEAAFWNVDGVLSTTVGYTGGTTLNPSYEQVCTGRTGHAEAVEVVYDPERVGYADLLETFWASHDPTTMNRQGPDVGTQYRSAIFVHDDAQKKAALESREKLEESGRFRRPIVTEITPASEFFRAEEYHQKYFDKHGIASCPI